MAHVLIPSDDPVVSSIRYCVLPFLDRHYKIPTDYTLIRNHLDRHYCSTCGEYIFHRFSKRRVLHHHNRYKNRYIPLLYKRIRIYTKLELVVWERYNPFVLRLRPSRGESVSGILSRCGRRLPSVYQWTIDEWDFLYPFLSIGHDNIYFRLHNRQVEDPLFVPDISYT